MWKCRQCGYCCDVWKPKCAHLKDGKCAVHGENKPPECKAYTCEKGFLKAGRKDKIVEPARRKEWH